VVCSRRNSVRRRYQPSEGERWCWWWWWWWWWWRVQMILRSSFLGLHGEKKKLGMVSLGAAVTWLDGAGGNNGGG